MTVRTRFAPSPTGFMHVGNLRTALYAWLWAKKNNGVFMLRIEDTDQARFVEGAEEVVYKTLRTAGLNWDEGPDIGGDYGPYVQSERKDMYLPYAKKLVEMGKAYYCFCTKEELEERRAAVEAAGGTFKYDKHCLDLPKEEVERRLAAGEPYVIRQNVPESGKADFDDAIFGHIEVDCSELDDMILIKADGMPTYNFANVIDDHTMGVTHVLRGMEYLSSTPKYNLLYEAFGWEKPMYVHLTTIMRDATHKLSKRDGDATFEDLVNAGYLPEAIINYLALVGWSPGDEREFFTLSELKDAFSLEGLSKSPAIFDHLKLRWMNAEYIRRMDGAAYFEKAKPWLEKAGVGDIAAKPENGDILTRILQPRTEIFSDIPTVVDFLASLDEDYDTELFTNKKSKTDAEVSKRVLSDVIPLLRTLPDWNETALHDLLLGFAAEKGMKNGTLLWPVRIAMSGRTVTPGGAIEIAALLGRDETLRRLELGLKKLGNE
ncbi:MAG: glutamate--tRNA ligase [Clostridia bacterium]|nr:glutamate--tRNA ligase [Clostridia bacterium]